MAKDTKRGADVIEFEKKTVEVKEKETKVKFDVNKKIANIEASKMPDWQKEKYIRDLLPEKAKVGIPFNVYVKLRDISDTVSEGMKVYPKAIGVGLAELEVWDEIFKDF